MKSLENLALVLLGEKEVEDVLEEFSTERPLYLSEFFEFLVQKLSQLYDGEPKEFSVPLPEERLTLNKTTLDKLITKDLVRKAMLKDYNLLNPILDHLSTHDPKLREVKERLSFFLKRPLFLTDLIKP